MDNPILFNSQYIPFDLLDEDKFEDFIIQITPYILPEVKIIGSSLKVSDGGFDARAKHQKEGYYVCIQCKRYKTKLSLTQIATELAKVALTSKENSFETKEHYFFTIVGSTKEAFFIENTDRKKVKEAAIAALNVTKNFKTTKKNLLEQGVDLKKTVNEYIDNLELIDIYDKTRIDGNLAKHWDYFLKNIATKFFTVQSVVEKYPRPDFNFKNFIDEIKKSYKSNYEEFFVRYKHIAKNINGNKKDKQVSERILAKNIIDALPKNKISFLFGIGGLGKTTSCEIINYNFSLLNSKSFNYLPIKIRASHFEFEKDIQDLIHTVLNINCGYWHSMPYTFLIIIDGLNEISDSLKAKLLYELNQKVIKKNNDIKILITSREGKFLSKFSIENMGLIFELEKLSFIDMRKLSYKYLSEKDTENLLCELDQKYRHFSKVRTPFFVLKSIQTYEKSHTLPNNFGDLLKNYFLGRYNENEKKISPDFRAIIDSDIILRLFSNISFHFRVKENKKSINLYDLKKYLKTLTESTEFSILEDCKINDLLSLLLSFEILITENKIYEIEHDILADYFAASHLAHDWDKYLSLLDIKENDLLWLFTAQFVNNNQSGNFLKEIANKDLTLACKCFNNMETNELNILDKIIIERYKLNRQFYNWQSIESMYLIGSPKYIELLNTDLNNLEVDDSKKKFIKRSLAKMGDIEVCKQVLSKAEEEESIPFMKITNGDKDLWFNVPLKLRLNFERKKIKDYLILLQREKSIKKFTEGCVLSLQNLRIIGGTNEDIEMAKQVLENSRDYFSLFYAYFLILVNNAHDNTQYLSERLKIFGFEEKYEIALQANNLGVMLLSDQDIEFSIKTLYDVIILIDEVKNKKNEDIDFENLKKINFDEPKIIDYLKSETKERDVVEILDSMYRKISAYLKSIKLNEKNQALVLSILQRNELIKSHSIFWEISKNNNCSDAIELAHSLMLDNNLKVISKALCFLNDMNEIIKINLDIVSKKIVNSTHLWDQYEYYDVLIILLKRIKSKSIKEFVNKKLIEIISDDKFKENLINLQFEKVVIRYFDLASLIVHDIDEEIIIASFGYKPASHWSKMVNVYLIFLRKLSEKRIDSSLSTEIHYNMKFLQALSKINKTPKRIEIMLHMINKAATLHVYEDIIKSYWCDEIAEFVVNNLSDETREDEFINFYTFHYLFTSNQATKFIKPLLDKETDEEKKNIMSFWIDSVDNRRKPD